MWVQIGKQPRARDEDPVSSLLACHERIRRFCGLAAKLASSPEAPPTEIASAAEAVARYFAVALPLHAEDEDATIRPLLLERGATVELEQAMEAMSSEHRIIEELLEALGPRWSQVAREPEARVGLARGLGRDTERLRELFETHLSREEETLFPAVARLGPGDQALIRTAMRRRRGFVPE